MVVLCSLSSGRVGSAHSSTGRHGVRLDTFKLVLVKYYKTYVPELCPCLQFSIYLSWFCALFLSEFVLPVPLSLVVKRHHLCPPSVSLHHDCFRLLFLTCATSPLLLLPGVYKLCCQSSVFVIADVRSNVPCWFLLLFFFFLPDPPVVYPDCLVFHSQFNYSSCPQWIYVCPS